MRRLFDDFHRFFLRLHRTTVTVIVLVLIALLGWLDYVTGFEISFSFFYLIPIGIATWYIGIRFGHFITAVGIIVWGLTNWLAGETYSSVYIRFWNVFVRFIVFFAISTLLDQFKLALEKERLLARTDHLTGIFNRREFYAQAELEIKRASRYQQPLSIAYLDLDQFKKVNDDHGHQAGDRLLQDITQTILHEVRQTDVFARLGGDEFALLLPNSEQKAARVVVEKLEKAVSEKMRATGSPVTLSAGVVTFLSAPASVDELIHRADALMYQAKLLGKSRTFYFQVT